MSNWTAIAESDVRETRHASLLETVQARAAALGDGDPLPGYIAETVARIRTSVAQGNLVDSDAAKIPASLEALALRMIVRRLKGYLEMELTEDERAEAADDRSYLNRITDSKLKFEPADSPADPGVSQGILGTAYDTPPRLTGRDRASGL